MSVIIVLKFLGGDIDFIDEPEEDDITFTTFDEELAEKIMVCFEKNKNEALKFVKEIRDLKPTEITALVNQLTHDKKISRESNGTDLWTPLHEAGLYSPTIQNWNQQVKH